MTYALLYVIIVGVGSGWCYKLPNGQTFQLSVLYSASKQQRTQKSWDRMTGNNLIQVKKDEEGETMVELKPAVRDFCRTVDAFVFVVDSTSIENLSELSEHLNIILFLLIKGCIFFSLPKTENLVFRNCNQCSNKCTVVLIIWR